MTDETDLSRELTRVVRGTEGVSEVYPAGSAARAAALAAAQALSGTVDDPKVAVARGEDGRLEVAATIGVGQGHAVPATLRAVKQAISGHLLAAGAPPASIAVKASRIA